ncbi:MAG: CDP-glycerol glycerophosphotransferase family protein [Aeromicrobium sp.]
MGKMMSWATDRVRRSPRLPGTYVNRVSDLEDRLTPLTATVIVWFPTAPDSLYQIRPWFHALEQLHRVHPVLVVCRDSRVSAHVRAASSLNALSLGTSAELDELLAISPDVRIALYVNLDPLDFDCLRFRSMLHVYIGHGDSDKRVFASNQVKAFDHYFVAGSAAIDRLEAELMFYDARGHAVVIGQPQLDGAAVQWEAPVTGPGSRIVYAPTWEGAHPSMSYTSVSSHGEAIVSSLLRAGHEIVYRPHPFTGRHDPTAADADRRIRAMVMAAGHHVDETPDLRASFGSAAALITDVSAVVSYWMPSGRPVLVTVPDCTDAAPGTLATRLPRLRVADAAAAADHVADLLRNPPNVTDDIATHLGDVTPGAATTAFVEAVSAAISRRNAAWDAKKPA